MDILLTVLSFPLLLFPVMLIIGLIKPKRILRWSKTPTRLKVVGWWFLVMLLYFVAFGGLVQLADSMKSPAEIISESEKDIANGRYNTAIRRLEKIAPADSLYDSSLLNRAKMLSYLKKSDLMVLIVTNIFLDGRQIIFKFSDEKYNTVEMSKDADQWFNNVSSISVTIPENTMFTGDDKGNLIMIGKALLDFSFNGENYSWEIGKFSELIVQKTDRGPCTLYPEETLKFFFKSLEKR